MPGPSRPGEARRAAELCVTWPSTSTKSAITSDANAIMHMCISSRTKLASTVPIMARSRWGLRPCFLTRSGFVTSADQPEGEEARRPNSAPEDAFEPTDIAGVGLAHPTARHPESRRRGSSSSSIVAREGSATYGVQQYARPPLALQRLVSGREAHMSILAAASAGLRRISGISSISASSRARTLARSASPPACHHFQGKTSWLEGLIFC